MKAGIFYIFVKKGYSFQLKMHFQKKERRGGRGRNQKLHLTLIKQRPNLFKENRALKAKKLINSNFDRYLRHFLSYQIKLSLQHVSYWQL